MKEMTAVEFLAERYNYITWMRNRDEISAGKADEWRAESLEEAKEMEEQQLNKAWQDGALNKKNKEMKEMTYRLEYSDNQKRFFLNYNRRCLQNTNGYITIFENITDMEFAIFEEYLFTMRDKSKWDNEFVLGASILVPKFTKNLLNRNISFTKL